MRACNWGDTLTRRVHENAAKRTAATTTRAQFCERAELFIALRPSDSRGRCASNFLGSACPRIGDAFGCPVFVLRTSYSEVLPVLSSCVWKTTWRLPGPKVFDAARARTFSAHLVFS